MTIEQHIEELRAELGNAEPAERRRFEAELELAQVELAAAIAEQQREIDAAPPF